MEADPNFKLINADFIEEAGGTDKFYEQFAANLRDILSKNL